MARPLENSQRYFWLFPTQDCLDLFFVERMKDVETRNFVRPSFGPTETNFVSKWPHRRRRRRRRCRRRLRRRRRRRRRHHRNHHRRH